jgi:hypothetical protein
MTPACVVIHGFVKYDRRKVVISQDCFRVFLETGCKWAVDALNGYMQIETKRYDFKNNNVDYKLLFMSDHTFNLVLDSTWTQFENFKTKIQNPSQNNNQPSQKNTILDILKKHPNKSDEKIRKKNNAALEKMNNATFKACNTCLKCVYKRNLNSKFEVSTVSKIPLVYVRLHCDN